MPNLKLEPYLFFPGNCREAMEFYKGIFGGELNIQSMDDIPGPKPENSAGKVMHAQLDGGVINLMGSDSSREEPYPQSSISLSIGGSDEELITSIFNKLSQGGKNISPIKKEMWGDLFGSLTDKFGVDWMVNIGLPATTTSTTETTA
jgi:PhnB protein